jgi:hypothetical protein
MRNGCRRSAIVASVRGAQLRTSAALRVTLRVSRNSFGVTQARARTPYCVEWRELVRASALRELGKELASRSPRRRCAVPAYFGGNVKQHLGGFSSRAVAFVANETKGGEARAVVQGSTRRWSSEW